MRANAEVGGGGIVTRVQSARRGRTAVVAPFGGNVDGSFSQRVPGETV